MLNLQKLLPSTEKEEEQMNEIVKVILSWPTVCIVALLVLRKPISALFHRLIHSDSGAEAEIGPIKITGIP